MPKQALFISLEEMVWGEYEDPPLEPDQILIRSELSSAKHGTDTAFLKGYGAKRGRYDRDKKLFIKPEPQPKQAKKKDRPKGSGVGNMTVGTVVDAGPEVQGIAVGDRVATPGGFRETHIRSAGRVRKMPAGLSDKSAVCLDPADFALGAVRDGHVRVGDRVAVFGTGAIGLMAVQLAKVAGASVVFAVEPLPSRRKAAEAVGADAVFDPTDRDVGAEIKKLTDWAGVDVAIEYSGNWRAMQAALRCVAWGGNVVAGAFPPPHEAGLDLGAESHQHLPSIIFSRSCSQPDRDHPRWDHKRVLDTCWQLLCEGRICGDEVVTKVIPFDDILTEYPKIVTEPDKYVKIACDYPA